MAFVVAPDNMLNVLLSSASDPVTQVCAGLFGIMIIGLGIPIFCVLMRYNLVVGGLCSPFWGNFWGSVFPWLVSWTLYQGHFVLEMLSWSGLLLNGFIDFICPILVSVIAVRAILQGSSQTVIGQTVVAALPDRLLPHYELIGSFLGVVVGAIVSAGIVFKTLGDVREA
uniref:Uncharacterized protein n=1 Tax=Octactis speculum TaxID=3111310 RepID=A0A7S2D668_9STRA|mmetsp:Transcript_43601/g.59548  ORF Transcript_43601/g.59548 Transcript_43601/m.59548 type:complete len:169 (+) Transcript_43601:3-509(+)